MNQRRDDPEDRDRDRGPGRDQDWDDVVDVICVGSTPGVLAYLSACAASDLDVLHVAAPDKFDGETSAYLAAMTEDLDGLPDGTGSDESEPVTTKAAPAPLRRDGRGRPDTLDTFFGEQLRTWSARCLASPLAVLLSEVSDLFTRMRTTGGETICAVVVPENGENDSPTESFAGFVYEEGRLAGAVVDDGSGPRTVRAEAGLALPIGPAGPWPDARSLALVSRPAGRFARLEVLEPLTDE